MRFCKDCGSPLNLFSDREKDLCSACLQQKRKAEQEHPPASLPDLEKFRTLIDTTLSVENGKIILRSKEGWELWSANQRERVEMKTILSRAGRIYEIRFKRQKN